MKKILYSLLLLVLALAYTSCENYETYADKKEAERDAINDFIAREGIQVISEQQFVAQDSTTDLSKNQYVYFDRNGVYMQIVRKGVGEKLAENKSTNILCRFVEKNIQLDSIILRNDIQAWLTYNGTTYDTSLYVSWLCFRSCRLARTSQLCQDRSSRCCRCRRSGDCQGASYRSPLTGHFRCFGQRLSLLLRDYLPNFKITHLYLYDTY